MLFVTSAAPLLAFSVAQADAHVVTGANAGPATIGATWGEGWIAALLLASGAAYAIGVARVWRASARGRGIRVRDAVAFTAGCLVVAAALLGPLDAAASRSFAAHMAQHELLMLVAAPLLVLGRPLGAWAWMLPSRAQPSLRAALASSTWMRIWRSLTRPLGATLAQLSVLFVLHVPALFDYAVMHAGAHAAQHGLFLASALCFWWATRPALRTAGNDAALGVSIGCLFVTMLATGALGAMLTFATSPWYAVYRSTASPWAATPVNDQQLGGLLMWIPGGTIYLVAALHCARELLSRRVSRSSTAARAGALR